MKIKFTTVRCLLALLTVLSVSGCGPDIVYRWKMLPKDNQVLARYRECIVDVHVKDELHLSRQVSDRMTRMLRDSIIAGFAGKYAPVSADHAGPRTLHTQVFITRYDDGRVFATSAFQDSDSIRISGDVSLSDWQTGEKLAEFGIQQTYDRSNTIGSIPRIEQLEPEFVQKVVAGIAQLPL